MGPKKAWGLACMALFFKLYDASHFEILAVQTSYDPILYFSLLFTCTHFHSRPPLQEIKEKRVKSIGPVMATRIEKTTGSDEILEKFEWEHAPFS